MTKKSYYNFKFKNCLCGANNLVKSSDKDKYEYSGYRKTFDSGVHGHFVVMFYLQKYVFQKKQKTGILKYLIW